MTKSINTVDIALTADPESAVQATSAAAGISRQAAHARWGRRVRAILDRYGTGDPGGPVADDVGDLGE